MFCITYKKIIKCNGLCKYKNKKEYFYNANPYIEIDENKINNNVTNKVEDIIFNDIFASTEKICDQNECFMNNNYIKSIKYENVLLPKIITFNININEFNILKTYQNKLNDIFTDEINIKENIYSLVGIIFNENDNHFICLSLNLSKFFNIGFKNWLYFDDLKGKLEILDNNLLGYQIIRANKYPCMFIYMIKN